MELLKIYDLTTLEGKQAEARDQIVGALTAMVRNNVNACQGLMRLIFANARGLTPQQVCDVLDTDAASVLVAGNGLAQVVNGLRPNTLSLDPPGNVTFVPNVDGTVTIRQQ